MIAVTHRDVTLEIVWVSAWDAWEQGLGCKWQWALSEKETWGCFCLLDDACELIRLSRVTWSLCLWSLAAACPLPRDELRGEVGTGNHYCVKGELRWPVIRMRCIHGSESLPPTQQHDSLLCVGCIGANCPGSCPEGGKLGQKRQDGVRCDA